MSERLVESGYGEGILQLYEVLIPYLQKSIWILGDAALQLMGMGAAAQVAHCLAVLEKRSVHNGDY